MELIGLYFTVVTTLVLGWCTKEIREWTEKLIEPMRRKVDVEVVEVEVPVLAKDFDEERRVNEEKALASVDELPISPDEREALKEYIRDRMAQGAFDAQ